MLLENSVIEDLNDNQYPFIEDDEQVKLEILSDFIQQAIDCYYDSPIIYFD